ncbi:hypothetical protein FOZ62_012846 [Perkinsus olseni]|uniref:Uncharacterized protein n=1 Tax=Perkinsus olseni TaxID=32597 RepID=A0A7J6NA18_PEROL|nr:hypothetical protein FOZ62_012846 [Perkinsus olseni]
MRLLSKVFISLVASVAHGSSPPTASRPLEWLFGESMTTGHRYYIEPAMRLSKLYSAPNDSYVVNDGIKCVPATQSTRYNQDSSISIAWVTSVGGPTEEHCPVCQREYTVKVNAYASSGECFPAIETTTDPDIAENVRNDLNDVCIHTDFKLMKGSTNTVIDDGEYIGEKDGVVKLEVTPSKKVGELVYFAVGDVLSVSLSFQGDTQDSEPVELILEPSRRELSLEYEKIDWRKLKFWDRNPPNFEAVTEGKLNKKKKGKRGVQRARSMIQGLKGKIDKAYATL